MLQKIIYQLAPIIISTNYALIALKIQLKKLLTKKSQNIELDLLYEKYIKAVRKKEIFPQSKSKNHQIFLEYRKSNNGKLSGSAETYLLRALDGNSSRWFVPYVLAVIDDFSEALMGKLIETGIKVGDPSYNSSFAFPAQRVFDLKVNDYLVERFPKANDREKGGILRLFYWVNSRLSISMYQGITEERYNKHYIWEEDKFKAIPSSEPKEIESYKKLVLQKRQERITLLLDEYFKASEIRMKEAIAWYLPKKLDDFPDKLQVKAVEYLSMAS